MKKIYLAIPYSYNPDQSFWKANRITAQLMKEKDVVVFSPISHSHPIAKQEQLPSDWSFWQQFDEAFIEWCDELWVVNDDPVLVSESHGVQAEIEIARKLNKPLSYIYSKNSNWIENKPGTLDKIGECEFFGVITTNKGTEYYHLVSNEFGDLQYADEYMDCFSEWGPDDFYYILIK